jgi:exodeoxyribonuclease V gamma subunit
VLHLHRADRADRLIGALAGVLHAPAGDAFAAEVVAVPTRGVERWLTQRLSGRLGTEPGRGDGICANVAFPSPRRLVDEVVAAASGFDPDADPWLPERMVWPLLEVVDAQLAEPWLAPVAAHLDRGRGDRSRRLRMVQHLAVLYDRYALYRPELLQSWQAGAGDDWQAELWRRLRARLAEPGPAERQESASRRLLADPGLSPLPDRISLFGLTRLPARQLEILAALADARDVHLFLLQPSDASWGAVAAAFARHGPVRRRAQLPAAFLPGNPLLASWGRDARELQLAIAQVADAATDQHHHVEEDDEPPRTLLARLQADVRADRAPAPAPPLAGDRSLQIHGCHGTGRQVEVLRDAILHALQDDPTLEPRDVIVMCPDIELFAPLIEATFGAGEALAGEDAGESAGRPIAAAADLRVRLADRALRETNPVLGVVARLLELTTARVTASELLDLADREPVRRRFRLGQDDMSRLEEWTAAAGARWGLDAAHRTPFGLGRVAQGTWRAGLDRLLTGVAMSEDEPRLVEGVLPLDDVDSSAIDLAGRLAEYVDRLEAILDGFAGAQPIDAWARLIADAAGALTAPAPSDAWQRAELERLLADVVDEATTEGAVCAAPLDAADVAALLERRLAGRPTRASFRTGHLTVCTLQPMRSVPHRVVCLLGLDDTVFPRRSPRDGDDLLLADPQLGDRDARTEDRQILLDALMAATDRLIITYTASDERTNAVRAPAVPVSELLDVVARVTGDRDAALVAHPLQPFDTRNFEPGALGPDGPWSFDAITLAGARASVAQRVPRRPFLAGPLPAADRPLIELNDLVAFLGHPVRAFLRQRLGVGAGIRAQELDDALPLELDHLEQWAVGRRLLDARLAGVGASGARTAERARGALPPGAIGQKDLETIGSLVESVLDAAGGAIDRAATRRAIDLHLDLQDGRTLGGTVSGLVGDTVTLVTFSRVRAEQRLGAWARVLALTAAEPERPFAALTVGRARRGAPRTRRVTIAGIPPLPGATAGERRAAALAGLHALIDLYDRGMREPLPLYTETSAAFATGANASDAWTTPYNKTPREDRDEAHVRVLGGVVPFADVLRDPRFDPLAHQLWDGLLAVEELSDR